MIGEDDYSKPVDLSAPKPIQANVDAYYGVICYAPGAGPFNNLSRTLHLVTPPEEVSTEPLALDVWTQNKRRRQAVAIPAA
jgi:hypothetical protein